MDQQKLFYDKKALKKKWKWRRGDSSHDSDNNGLIIYSYDYINKIIISCKLVFENVLKILSPAFGEKTLGYAALLTHTNYHLQILCKIMCLIFWSF